MSPGRWYIVGLLGLAAIALAYIAGGAGSKQRPNGDPDFITPDAELELLVDGTKEGLVFSEGVVVTCDRRVLFSDMAAEESQIVEYHPDSRTLSVFRAPSGGSNGNRMDPACHLLTAERHRLVRTDLTPAAPRSWPAPRRVTRTPPSTISRSNSKGRIYVTHPRYGAKHPNSIRQPGADRVDPDGSVTQNHHRRCAAEWHRLLSRRSAHLCRQL